jgi:hypothetical protein
LLSIKEIGVRRLYIFINSRHDLLSLQTPEITRIKTPRNPEFTALRDSFACLTTICQQLAPHLNTGLNPTIYGSALLSLYTGETPRDHDGLVLIQPNSSTSPRHVRDAFMQRLRKRYNNIASNGKAPHPRLSFVHNGREIDVGFARGEFPAPSLASHGLVNVQQIALDKTGTYATRAFCAGIKQGQLHPAAPINSLTYGQMAEEVKKYLSRNTGLKT